MKGLIHPIEPMTQNPLNIHMRNFDAAEPLNLHIASQPTFAQKQPLRR